MTQHYVINPDAVREITPPPAVAQHLISQHRDLPCQFDDLRGPFDLKVGEVVLVLEAWSVGEDDLSVPIIHYAAGGAQYLGDGEIVGPVTPRTFTPLPAGEFERASRMFRWAARLAVRIVEVEQKGPCRQRLVVQRVDFHIRRPFVLSSPATPTPLPLQQAFQQAQEAADAFVAASQSLLSLLETTPSDQPDAQPLPTPDEIISDLGDTLAAWGASDRPDLEVLAKEVCRLRKENDQLRLKIANLEQGKTDAPDQ